MKFNRSSFANREYLTAGFILATILVISFYNVIFLGETLSTSSLASGTMPSGPYYSTRGAGYLYVIDPGATAWQDEPYFVLASELYKSHIMPIWNPYIAFGTPFAAEIKTAVYFPLNFLVFLAPKCIFWDVVDLVTIFRLFIAGFFTYIFMRELNINKYGSFIASIAFMLNGYFIYYINMSHHLNAEILIPILLFSLEKLIKTQNIKFCIISAFLVALSVFGGMPESTLFLLFFAALYYFYRLLYEYNITKNTDPLKMAVFLFFLSCSFGVLLSSILTLPFVEYLAQSWNLHPPSRGLGHHTFSFDTISIVIPYFFGWYHHTWNGISGHAILPYVGVLPLFFSLCAVYNKERFYKLTLLFASFVVFFLLKTYGFPVVNWIGYLPLFNVSVFPKYCYPEFAFCIAVLAGIGFESIGRLNSKLIWSQMLLIVIAIFFFLAKNINDIINATWSHPIFGIELTTIQWVFANITFALIILLVLRILFYVASKNRISERCLIFLLIVLVILELFVYIPHTRSPGSDPFEPAPYIQFLKNDSDVFRVVGLDNILYPNTASAYGIFDIRGFSPMHVDRYMDFINKNIDSSPRFSGNELRINNENKKFINLINTKYILTMGDLVENELEEYSLIDDIIDDGKIVSPNRDAFVKKTDATVLFEHPPSRIDYELLVPNESVSLNFSIALDSAVWSPDKGDGVLFELRLDKSDNEQKLFSKYIDPKNNIEDRMWHYGEINLSDYRGTRINISLVTLPNNNSAYDWAYWRGLYLKTSEYEEAVNVFNEQFELVYDDEIKIYKNKMAFPRSYVVHNATYSTSREDIFSQLSDPKFDPREVVILEKTPLDIIVNDSYLCDIDGNRCPHNSSSEINEYNPNYVILNVSMGSPGFLVLTDTYYPGWKVYVDGEEKELLIANYLFRAVFLESGTHTVRFIYDPLSFKIGFWISCLTLFSMLVIYLTKGRT